MPHVGALGSSAKPLKLAGAAPPLNEFVFAHWAPQKVTAVPFALCRSPITKAPPPGAKANASVEHEVVAFAPPTSMMVVVMVKGPDEAYVCEPLTVYDPPLGPLTTPFELEPSPQSIVAVKSE